jgi:hypothetical protein
MQGNLIRFFCKMTMRNNEYSLKMALHEGNVLNKDRTQMTQIERIITDLISPENSGSV